MNKTEFHIVLPSDSSMNYYPDNTASHYTTMLPQHIKLEGEWVVGLKEIQFPASFLHLQSREECGMYLISAGPSEYGVDNIYSSFYLPRGLYTDTKKFMTTLNSFPDTTDHFYFRINEEGFTTVRRICKPPKCKDTSHRLQLSYTLLDILGFDRYIDKNNQEDFLLGSKDSKSYEFKNISKRPFSLMRGLPSSLFIYSDICSPYVTGDVNSSLLRIVPLDTSSYSYGMTVTNTYGAPNYIPILSNSFRTIEIDIRNNTGDSIPFEYGPLNVTLHFKRVD